MLSTAATLASNLIGALLVGLAARDIFHELFHPGGSGSISQRLQRALWGGFRHVGRCRRRVLRLAGPLIFLAVVAAWGLLLALGWTFVFWPYLPEHFRFASPLEPSAEQGFGTALYVSLLALTTLGFGDITPTHPVLRVLANLEATLGFALVTAAVSWLLSIYPVLSRRRALAHRVSLLHIVRERSGRRVIGLDPALALPLMGELTTALAQVRVDLMQSGISYYFHDQEDASLAVTLPLVANMAEDGVQEGRAEAVRFAAMGLREAVRSYLDVVRREHLRRPEERLEATLGAYAADHLRDGAPERAGARDGDHDHEASGGGT